MDDLIRRQAAIDALSMMQGIVAENGVRKGISMAWQQIKDLPAAQPEYRLDEWCTECKEYDHERHCCPRFNHVIRTTLQDAQRTGRWIFGHTLGHSWMKCSECLVSQDGQTACFSYCPNCGAKMKGEEE